MHYMYYCKFSKIDVAEEKGMTMNSSEGLKLVMWKIDHSEFVKILQSLVKIVSYLTPFSSVTVPVHVILTNQYSPAHWVLDLQYSY